MDQHLVQDYLQKSDMNAAQADALSRIFAQMATKSDLLVLEQKLEKRLEALKAAVTWRIIAAMTFLATFMTLLDVVID